MRPLLLPSAPPPSVCVRASRVKQKPCGGVCTLAVAGTRKARKSLSKRDAATPSGVEGPHLGFRSSPGAVWLAVQPPSATVSTPVQQAGPMWTRPGYQTPLATHGA
eukprot:163791-Prorocentrum_minimum.AAC.1